MSAPLPDDWPKRFRSYVMDASTRYAAEMLKPFPDEEVELEREVTGVIAKIDDSSHEAFEAAPESWQRRFESAAIEKEIGNAVRYYAHNRGQGDGPRIVHGRLVR